MFSWNIVYKKNKDYMWYILLACIILTIWISIYILINNLIFIYSYIIIYSCILTFIFPLVYKFIYTINTTKYKKVRWLLRGVIIGNKNYIEYNGDIYESSFIYDFLNSKIDRENIIFPLLGIFSLLNRGNKISYITRDLKWSEIIFYINPICQGRFRVNYKDNIVTLLSAYNKF